MKEETRFETERQKAIERVRARGGDESKVCNSASEFLDGLTGLFCDTDGLTNEELREDLEANGVDVDAALDRVAEILREHGIKPKRCDLIADYQVEAKDDMF